MNRCALDLRRLKVDNLYLHIPSNKLYIYTGFEYTWSLNVDKESAFGFNIYNIPNKGKRFVEFADMIVTKSQLKTDFIEATPLIELLYG